MKYFILIVFGIAFGQGAQAHVFKCDSVKSISVASHGVVVVNFEVCEGLDSHDLSFSFRPDENYYFEGNGSMKKTYLDYLSQLQTALAGNLKVGISYTCENDDERSKGLAYHCAGKKIEQVTVGKDLTDIRF